VEDLEGNGSGNIGHFPGILVKNTEENNEKYQPCP
jgi:hypothetical protein